LTLARRSARNTCARNGIEAKHLNLSAGFCRDLSQGNKHTAPNYRHETGTELQSNVMANKARAGAFME
jgi:hypothetical protein